MNQTHDSHLRSGLGRQYAGDPIFLDLAFEIRAGERIGLVGPNGAGKTTLMKLLDGIESPEYGRSHVRPGIRISLLQQHPEFGPVETLMDVARSGLGSLLDLQRELEEAAQEMSEADDPPDRDRASRRYDELHERLVHQDAYSIDHRVEEVLCGLRFAPADFDRPARTFSGGQQSRLMLAKLLAREPRPHATGRALEPPRYRDHGMAGELPVAAAGGDARRQPRPLLSGQGRHQDVGAARGEARGLPGQLHALLEAPDREGQGAGAAGRAQEEKAEKLEAYIRKYGAGQRAKQAHDRERKLEKLQGERVDTMREIVGPVMGFEEVDRSGDIVIEARTSPRPTTRSCFRISTSRSSAASASA